MKTGGCGSNRLIRVVKMWVVGMMKCLHDKIVVAGVDGKAKCDGENSDVKGWRERVG